jgi:D-tyrosyl-tRNA(Tyr) deacylase
MRAVVQRVRRAAVAVGDERISEIGPGLLILLGIAPDDDRARAEKLAAKIPKLRIFDDAEGRPNEALGDREILCVSQFTLYADVKRGNRPSFSAAAPGEQAKPLYEYFCQLLGAKMGAFGEHMIVSSENDGPFTLLISEGTGL